MAKTSKLDEKETPRGAGLAEILKKAGSTGPAGAGLKAILAQRTKEQVVENLEGQRDEYERGQGNESQGAGKENEYQPDVYEYSGQDAYDEFLDKDSSKKLRYYVEMLEELVFMIENFVYGENSVVHRLGFDEKNLKDLYRAVVTVLQGEEDLITEDELMVHLTDGRNPADFVREVLFRIKDNTSPESVEEKVARILPAMLPFKQFVNDKRFLILDKIIRYVNENGGNFSINYDDLRKKFPSLPEERTEVLVDEKAVERTLGMYEDKGVLQEELRETARNPRQGARPMQGAEFSGAQPGSQPTTSTPEASDFNPLDIRAIPELKDTIIVLDTLEAVFKAPQDQFEADLKPKFDGADRFTISQYLTELYPQETLGNNLWGIGATTETVLEVISRTFKANTLEQLAEKAKEISTAVRGKYPNIHRSPKQDREDFFNAMMSE